MKRKLTIAVELIHRPPIVFLDEPTTRIDVASARQVRQLISALNTEGTTILLMTHYIEEAKRLCGWLAFVVRGRIARSRICSRWPRSEAPPASPGWADRPEGLPDRVLPDRCRSDRGV